MLPYVLTEETQKETQLDVRKAKRDKPMSSVCGPQRLLRCLGSHFEEHPAQASSAHRHEFDITAGSCGHTAIQPPSHNQFSHRGGSSMEISTLCTVAAALMVFPNRSQFFEYESISFSCGHHGSSGWAVKRTLSSGITEDCQGNESNCVLDVIYPSDSGLYWCESDSGECSNAINITVTDGSVILESPVHPVMEGDHVTLRCRNKTTSSSSFTADFYKDGLLIGSSSTGSMTIRTASKSHEGSYRCNISGCEASADSWLTVTARPPGAPQSKPVVYVLLPVVGVCVLLALMLLIGWRCHKDRGAAKTFYSKVKPGST